MARPRSLRRQLADLLAAHTPRVRASFLAAVEDQRRGVDVAALVEALRRQDIETAIAALNFSPAVYNEFRAEMTQAYAAAGRVAAAMIPAPPVVAATPAPVIRFDMSDPRAESVISRMAGEAITHIERETMEAARGTILEGYAAGDGPDSIARNIAGRMDRATGRRTGGIVGLSEPQAAHVASMRRRLQSGDPAEMAKVFTMQRRDRRYDARIRKAIRDGRPVSAADVELLTGRYSDRLLALRGEMIARTETGQAVMASQAEAWRQNLDKIGRPEEVIVRTWQHGGGGKDPRIDHIAMDGAQVRGLSEPFVMPDGVRMLHPLDSAGGVKHNAGCTCSMLTEIDYDWEPA